jgi:hypothetical protein
METQGTQKKLESVRIKFTVNGVDPVGQGISNVTLTPIYDHTLGQNQILGSGETLKSWVLPFPTNIALFKPGDVCYMEIDTRNRYSPNTRDNA